jgi:hypothetical protein
MHETRGIAWASCYLAPEDPVYDALSTVGEQMLDKGMRLIVFGVPGDYSRCKGFGHIVLPFSLVDQGRLFADFFAGQGMPVGAATVRELLALDKLFGLKAPESEAELLILRAVAFWERAFDIMQPSVILGWGTTVPFARLLIRLGQRRQIPSYVLERGLFEDTLSLSLSGQIALSSVTTSPALVRPEPLESAQQEKWQAIESYYRDLHKNRYAAFNKDPDPTVESYLHSDPGPRVLFLASGFSLSDPEIGDRVDPWVDSSAEAAKHVVTTLNGMGCGGSFWCKEHPTVPFTIPEMHGITVRNMPNINVRRLVQDAHIVVTLTSMTQALGLIYDRPIVSLGNGFFMGRDIAYEVSNESELRPALAAALLQQGWSERLARGRALAVAMMEHDLFGLSDAAPTRLKLSDMALLIGRFARYVKAETPSAEKRIASFMLFRKEAEGHRSVDQGHRDTLLAEIDKLREETASLILHRSESLSDLRKTILERARMVFDPSDLHG